MGNVGKKIKVLAWIIFALGILYLLYVGLDALTRGSSLVVTTGLVTMFAGIISSGITMLLVYGFGELIDKTCDTNKEIRLLRRAYLDRSKEILKKYKCPNCGNEITLGQETCSDCKTTLEWWFKYIKKSWKFFLKML